MRFHSQNLNERNGNVIRSILWHGRAWLYTNKEIHWEWCLGKHARMFHWGIEFGQGDGDDGLMLYAGIPFLFALYFGIAGVWRPKKPFEVGLSVHSNSVWLKLGAYCNESRASDPWYRRTIILLTFPWELRHYKTEILEHKRAEDARVVYVKSREKGFLESWDECQGFQKSVSQTYPYRYVLKNGNSQERQATVYVDRMIWRARWWPVIPRQKVRTSINVNFDSEVGEGTGSWKGGCIGCGYEMLPNETPLECLRRMEVERKFNR